MTEAIIVAIIVSLGPTLTAFVQSRRMLKNQEGMKRNLDVIHEDTNSRLSAALKEIAELRKYIGERLPDDGTKVPSKVLEPHPPKPPKGEQR